MFRQSPLAATPRSRRLFVRSSGFDELVAYASRGYNVLVVAPRGGGKTSALRQLQLALEEEAHPDDPVVAFVDLSGVQDADQALLLMINAARSANGLVTAGRPEDPRLGPPFEMGAAALIDALARLPRCRFLLDNIDAASAGYPIFGRLRDRLWETDHQYIVAVDEVEHRELLRPPADAFWEQVVRLTLSEEQAVDLIRRRADDDASWAERLVASVGPHPRRLIAAAQRIEAGQQDPPAITAEYLRRRRKLAELSSLARNLFGELEAVGPMSASDARLLRRIGVSRPAIDRGLRELEAAELARSYFEIDGPGRPRRVYELLKPPSRT